MKYVWEILSALSVVLFVAVEVLCWLFNWEE